jgi:hypothetical protein
MAGAGRLPCRVAREPALVATSPEGDKLAGELKIGGVPRFEPESRRGLLTAAFPRSCERPAIQRHTTGMDDLHKRCARPPDHSDA